MWWRFRQGSKKVHADVRSQLVSQFRLDPQVVDKMRCVTMPGVFDSRRIRRTRVFDPALITNGSVPIQGYDDLANHREALLFEGHIYTNGQVCLADRRPLKNTRISRATPSSIPGHPAKKSDEGGTRT